MLIYKAKQFMIKENKTNQNKKKTKKQKTSRKNYIF